MWRLATWCRYKREKNINMSITRQPFVLSHEIAVHCLCPKCHKYLWGHLRISKKHGRHWPMKFEHLLDKVNRGQSERNLVGLFDSRPQRSVRNFKEISHWGAVSHFLRA